MVCVNKGAVSARFLTPPPTTSSPCAEVVQHHCHGNHRFLSFEVSQLESLSSCPRFSCVSSVVLTSGWMLSLWESLSVSDHVVLWSVWRGKGNHLAGTVPPPCDDTNCGIGSCFESIRWRTSFGVFTNPYFNHHLLTVPQKWHMLHCQFFPPTQTLVCAEVCGGELPLEIRFIGNTYTEQMSSGSNSGGTTSLCSKCSCLLHK